MNKFKLVSVDMFQTLVDVNTRCFHAGRRMLGDLYGEELAEECWNDASKLILTYFGSHSVEKDGFFNTRHGFEQCYKELWRNRSIDIDPLESARILAEEHSAAESYEEAETFIETVRRFYPVCLISDADIDMIEPLLGRFKFDKAYISESEGSYKYNSKMFKSAIEYFKVQPFEILHIGDGYSDIAGAGKAGIKTCWLNRKWMKWKHEIKPDYTIASLIDALPILGIENTY